MILLNKINFVNNVCCSGKFLDDKCFFLKTKLRDPYYLKNEYNGKDYCMPKHSRPLEKYSDIEGYYTAFNYYDGDILRSTEEFPAAVDPKDAVSITEYEVLWCY